MEESRTKMPKKRPADERSGGRAAKLSNRRRRRHLYLVLDDWERGYSIRKLDLSSDDSDDFPMVGRTEQRLPPAVFRLEAPHALSGLFAAFGTKIIATHQTPRRTVFMWDVCTRALSFGPRHKFEPNSYCNIYVEVNGQLFLLDDASFEVLDPPPPLLDDAQGNVEIVWKWEKLPAPPFTHHVVSHAVHPDERNIFFSSEKKTQKRTKVATFSFDTESCKWTRHGGEWRLPFKGRGYFDPDLEAWVGLSDDPDTLGHLCTCELVSAADVVHQPPLWKLSKEKLFCVDHAEKHIGATLVYMGSRSKYCLVQCLSINDRKKDDIWEEFLPDCLQYLLRVKTFFLKYDRNGDLRAVVHGQVRSYRLPKRATGYCDHLERPVAFWM